VTESSKYPYDRRLLDENKSNEQVHPSEYKSLIMSLFYVGKSTRCEILFPVSYLATFSNAPYVSHWDKAIMVLKYLYGTAHYQLIHRCDGDYKLIAYIDASYLTHPDSKSHTGCLIYDRNNLLEASSNKQQLVTKSSTEAEVTAVHSKTNILEAMKELYSELTGINNPVIVYQDNKSAIHLMTNGTSESNKSRHMKGRYNYLSQLHEQRILRYLHKCTKEMKSDILTKPIFGKSFHDLVTELYHL
jgi:hypothetical protein